MQLRVCDGSDFQRFVLNGTVNGPSGKMMPSSIASGPVIWGLLHAGGPTVGPSSRPGGGCSHGVGQTGPCCVKTNGWWDWNLGPCSSRLDCALDNLTAESRVARKLHVIWCFLVNILVKLYISFVTAESQ